MDITMTTNNTLKIFALLLLGCICLTESVPVLKFTGQITLETDGELGAILPWGVMSKMIESDRFMNTDTENSSEYYSGEQNDLDVSKRANNRSELLRYLYSGKLNKAASTMGRNKPGRR